MVKNEKLKKLDVDETKGVSGGRKIYFIHSGRNGRIYYFINPKTGNVETANKSSIAYKKAGIKRAPDSAVRCENVNEVAKLIRQGEPDYPFAFND